MATEQAAAGTAAQTVTTVPSKGYAATLMDSTALTTDMSGAVSSIVSVRDFDEVWIWVKADVGAAGAYAHIAVLVSGEQAAPALGDDSWYALPERDASATATLLTGSLPTGADYTIAPEWGVVKVRPLVIRTEDGDAGTDKIRFVQPINVKGAHWMYCAAEEVGGNMTLALRWSGVR